MNPNNNQQWVNAMLTDPQNQIPNSSSSSNPNTPTSANSISSNFNQFPFQIPNQFTAYNPYLNQFSTEEQLKFQQFQLQQQLRRTQLSQQLFQQQSQQQPHQQSQQQSQEPQEEPDETEPIGTFSQKRTKKIAKKPKDKPEGSNSSRNLWSQDEELILAECFIQVSEDPNVGVDQNKDTFWYRVLEIYNKEAEKKKFVKRTKNMLTGKWTPLNKDVKKFNDLVDETQALSEENDEDLMSRVHIIFSRIAGYTFKHKSAWFFLKDKHKWKNPDSTQARRNRLRVNEDEPELFGDDPLPRPPGKQRPSKSQRSSNSSASSGSNPVMFQEMLQQQYALDREAKLEKLERETAARVELINVQKRNEELKAEALYVQKKGRRFEGFENQNKGYGSGRRGYHRGGKNKDSGRIFSQNLDYFSF